MSNNDNPKRKLGSRQIDVQRRNLIQMCRLTVKSLIDKSSYEPVDDSCEELVNFFAVMEQLLLFRMRPQKTWYGGEEGRHYWDYLKVACRKMSHSCITNIESIENIKTSRGKGRAWLRVALMEKRLSEYISMALQQSKISKTFYLDGSVILSEDSSMLCGTVLGLNAIDFSFCLKGDNLELMGPLVVDYSPYLQFQQSSESIMGDSEEEAELSNANISSSIMSEVDMNHLSWSAKYKSLENKFKSISEQKGYLEELVRLRQSQLDEATKQRHHMIETLQHYESESMKERQQLEAVIIELQGQLVTVKEQLRTLQRELTCLKARVLPQPANSQSAIAMKDMAGVEHGPLPRQILPSQESDAQSQDSSELGNSGTVPSQLLISGETRTMLSHRIMKEETQSLVPLAGSFSSEVSFRSGDLQMSALSKASSGLPPDSEQTTGKRSESSTLPGMESGIQISISDTDESDNWIHDPLQVEERQVVRTVRDNFHEDEASDVAINLPTAELKEENGNIGFPVGDTVAVRESNSTEPELILSQTESSEVRSSPDGEVSEEDKTILSAIVSDNIPSSDTEKLVLPDKGQQKITSAGDDSSSSDDGRAPTGEITVDETSSDNSNGEWTLLPHSQQQEQEVSTSSGDGVVVVSGETSPEDLSREELQEEEDDHSG